MSAARAKRLVLLAMLVAGGTATLRAMRNEGRLPSVRVPIGTFIAGVMLATLAEFAPALAGGLAMLVLVSSALVSADAWKGLATATGSAAVTPTATPIPSYTSPVLV